MLVASCDPEYVLVQPKYMVLEMNEKMEIVHK